MFKMEKSFLSPAEVASGFIETGCKKAGLPKAKQFLLGILAGAYIAFAAEGSNVAIHTIESVGIGKALAGALFATGLMLVVVAGAELFTGNCLIVMAGSEKKASWAAMLRNWFFVYAGNFVGAMIVVLLIFASGQLDFSSGLLGGFTIKTAVHKVGLPFGKALVMGILCNWLVCLAVWMAAAAKDVAGKLLAIFFPIWLFIASGFEHCVANMYYIPAGILAKSNPVWIERAVALDASPEAVNGLDWGSFLTGNLLPVTFGNIIGGAVFVGLAYWVVYLRAGRKA
jgi:formate/nitrite transporter